jgi:hypothetical protein
VVAQAHPVRQGQAIVVAHLRLARQDPVIAVAQARQVAVEVLTAVAQVALRLHPEAQAAVHQAAEDVAVAEDVADKTNNHNIKLLQYEKLRQLF